MEGIGKEQLLTSKSGKWKVTYNAPLTLTFTFISLGFVVFNYITAGWINQAFALYPNFSLLDSYRFFTYIFCHADWSHLAANSIYLLMLGPLLEEKYGAKELLFMTGCTALVTGLLNNLLFQNVIVGASGIVFMFIVLSSLVNMKRKEIPLTFILVSIVFIGNEVVNSFTADNISQFGHICGGLCGGAFGFMKRNLT